MHLLQSKPIHLLTHFSIDLAKIYFLIARNVFLFLRKMHHDTKTKPKQKKTFKQHLSILCVTEEKK